MIVTVKMLQDLMAQPETTSVELLDLLLWCVWNLQTKPEHRSEHYSGDVSIGDVKIDVELTFHFPPKRRRSR